MDGLFSYRRERNRIIRPLHGAHNKLNPSNDHHLGPSPAQCPVYTMLHHHPRYNLASLYNKPQQQETTRPYTFTIMCVQASNSIRIQSLSLFKDLSSLLPFLHSYHHKEPP